MIDLKINYKKYKEITISLLLKNLVDDLKKMKVTKEK